MEGSGGTERLQVFIREYCEVGWGAIECNRSNMDIVNDAINFTRDWLVIT